MTKEKYLELITKAINNLRDNEPYGRTPVDYMRDNGIKSTDKMTLFADSVGAYLEEIRCALVADIEAEEAKSNGKSSVLSNVKKFNKCSAEWRDRKPFISYGHYDKDNNEYWITDTYALLVGNSSEGMDLIPDKLNKAEHVGNFAYKKFLTETEKNNHNIQELPSVQKVAAYRKSAKVNRKNKYDKSWDRIVFKDFLIQGKYLEMAMRITGATVVKYMDYRHNLLFEGNGYKFVVCPMIRTEENQEEPTNFDNF